MPRRTNPGIIVTGPGKTVQGQTDSLVLIGAGMVGGPPNIGLPGHVGPSGTSPGWPLPGTSGPASGAAILASHLGDPKGAHAAVAISIDGHPALILSDNVEGALDELMGAIAPEPPKLGQWLAHMVTQFDGVPDWGARRMTDGPTRITAHAPPESLETGHGVYPFYWMDPTPTLDKEFTSYGLLGEDPYTDPIWNHVSSLMGTTSAFAGTRAGGYTDAGTDGVVRTHLIPKYSAAPWGATDEIPAICLSGALYPADRGVLALLHFPDPQSGDTFLTQTLDERCWGALLLGKGLYGSSFCSSSPGGLSCDGEPGGIFQVGTDANGDYDPFAYPGRATGQYNLQEMHSGLSVIDGSALPAPWVGGVKRIQNDTVPGPGQVRLGTDPAAGEADPTTYGIPILGATSDAYDPAPANDADLGERRIGHSVVMDANFFRYRLPYLADYSPTTGLKYTPSGEVKQTTRETGRYFDLGVEANDNNVWTEQVGATWYLKKGGNFEGFSQDYWTWQLARYRQIFAQKEAVGAGNRLGTLLLVHFKTEADFEKCARDGIMPWDGVNGYPTYSPTLTVDPVTAVPATYVDVVNGDTGAAPATPAPDYGYGADPYHNVRHNTFTAETTTAPSVVAERWTVTKVGVALDVTFVSGVAYAIPRVGTTNLDNVYIDGLSAEFQNAWLNGYRVDDNALTGSPAAAPASVSGPCSAFLSLPHFCYEIPPDPTRFPAGFADANLGFRSQRVELPLPFAGFNGTGLFSEANGPAAGDSLTVSIEGPAPLPVGNISLEGDPNTPAFSTAAAPRVFIRRPLHNAPIQPVTSTGYGQRLTLDMAPLTNVLFHSTGFHNGGGAGAGGHFGNFLTGGGVAYSTLLTTSKDTAEFFLDEVYRIASNFPGVADPVEQACLTGPGMAAWIGGPINVPVRSGNTAVGTWPASSWLQLGSHTGAVPNYELQVAGLPDRNPPPENWVPMPFPSAGILIYPRTNYSVGYWPPDAELAPFMQADYTGSAGTRYYVRCLDAAFSRSALLHQNAAGQTTVTLRLNGLTLEDFQFVAPGPGSTTVANVGIAVQIKVPGLTTWMDLGRRDGDGPSKQDVGLDGAGCQVVGPYTFNGVDLDTGVVYCQVRAHVGPAAALANGIANGLGRFEVPVLVRVVMTSDALDYDFTKKNLGPGSFIGLANPAIWAHRARGLVGLMVVHPNGVMTPTAQQLADWAAYMDPITGPGA